MQSKLRREGEHLLPELRKLNTTVDTKSSHDSVEP